MLISVERYRELTMDSASAESDVERGIADAENLIGEFLGRGLEAVERTESLEVFEDRAYPRCWPIVSVSEPDGTTVHEHYIENVVRLAWGDLPGPFFDDPSTVDVTYVGGWTDEDLPTRLAFAIAGVARNLLASVSSVDVGGPLGAKAVKVGDVSVTYASAAGSPGDDWRLQPISPLIAKALRPYGHRRP